MNVFHFIKYNVFLSFCLVLQIFISCSKSSSMVPISDVLPDDNNTLPEIFVDCNITSELSYQVIDLLKPQSFENEFQGEYSENYYNDFFGINNAKISVTINGVMYEFLESENHPDITKYQKVKGRYYSKLKFKGIPGKEHVLTITYNNKTYTATDIMMPIVRFTNVKELLSSNIPDYGLTFGTSTFGVSHPYIAVFEYDFTTYDVDSNYDIDSATIRTVKSSHYNYFFSKYVSPAFLKDIQDNQSIGSYGFLPNQMFNVKKQSVSEAYQDYLFAVFRESKWAFSKFRSTPANVPTNISNGGVGFFSTSDIYSDSVSYKTLLELTAQMK